jgi:RNA polymerase sigma factor (TIGR02999 family)
MGCECRSARARIDDERKRTLVSDPHRDPQWHPCRGGAFDPSDQGRAEDDVAELPAVEKGHAAWLDRGVMSRHSGCASVSPLSSLALTRGNPLKAQMTEREVGDQPVPYANAGPAEREQLLTLYYQELRTIARRLLRGEGDALLLQPTELAHEAAMRLIRLERMSWNDVPHFLATAARVMRQVFLDEVRRARAQKRQVPALTLWPDAMPDEAPFDIEALDAALVRLEAISPERARVVELRFYTGLSIEEIAVTCGISDRTVKRQWRAARAWLLTELAGA